MNKKEQASAIPTNNLELTFKEELIREVEQDFIERQKARKSLERQWELNMNFASGNQYCHINSRGEIDADGEGFYWQNREVFNHIAPTIESRLAKFSRINPEICVRPKTEDDKDVLGANVAEKLIRNALKRSDIKSVVKKVTVWSETCGTGFYKVVWNNRAGEKIGNYEGQDVYEGEAQVLPVSPFEIFPDNLSTENIQDCSSIIHARAMTVKDIEEKYGVKVKGGDESIFQLGDTSSCKNRNTRGQLKDACIVIERYEKQSKQFPCGRMVTVAGGELLYYGQLPYFNRDGSNRQFPFVKQVSNSIAGNFFGTSVIERLIPVQRSYNAVKNRKHEFLNRLSMGVLTVEDGSVDVDNLAEDGLSPGKILVYRQGSKAPEMMSDLALPPDFNEEEDKLINEFVIISGISDISSSSFSSRLTSGTALELLVEQDNEKLVAVAENIRDCYIEIARQVIRLYSQFLVGVKAIKIEEGRGNLKTFYADKSAVRSDDVYLENENELLYSDSKKKEMIFKLYESGLLQDVNGNLPASTKEKVLSLLGYKDLDYHKGISGLQEEKAKKENEHMRSREVLVEEIDDDSIHIDEHIRYTLSEIHEMNDEVKARYFNHIKAHKERMKKNREEEK